METTLSGGIKKIHFPDSCRNVPIVVGVDEAGRGPVLGPLIYCAAFWPKSEDSRIKSLGFDDSKQLKEDERNKLLNIITSDSSIGWVIEELSASYLSGEMLKTSPTSLNQLSYDAVIDALSKIKDTSSKPPIITDVYIDTVGDPETYKNRMIRGLGEDYGNFIIEKKADAKYKVVGAASIIAKVTRDRLLHTWKYSEKNYKEFDHSFGSGYPGDEQCVKWMERNIDPIFGYPNLVRFSWSTTRDALIKGKAVKVTWESEEDDNPSSAGTTAITCFFSVAGEKRPKRSPYFIQKKMKHVLPTDLNT